MGTNPIPHYNSSKYTQKGYSDFNYQKSRQPHPASTYSQENYSAGFKKHQLRDSKNWTPKTTQSEDFIDSKGSICRHCCLFAWPL